eukprot:scaffold77884_cov17-Tisochrysis_lutea.AAC.1
MASISDPYQPRIEVSSGGRDKAWCQEGTKKSCAHKLHQARYRLEGGRQATCGRGKGYSFALKERVV